MFLQLVVGKKKGEVELAKHNPSTVEGEGVEEEEEEEERRMDEKEGECQQTVKLKEKTLSPSGGTYGGNDNIAFRVERGKFTDDCSILSNAHRHHTCAKQGKYIQSLCMPICRCSDIAVIEYSCIDYSCITEYSSSH